MTFSDNLRNSRKKKGLSQKALAEKAGVSQASIYQWEKGTRTPKIGQVRNIASVLGLTISDLVDDWSMYSTEEYTDDWKDAIDELEKWTEEYSRGNTPENSWMRELKLLEHFRRLNKKGECKAIEQVELLTKISEYQKKEE